MSLSKKIRFEVFKRDSFKCGYCGKTPPEVTLEIDHINPISSGGSSEISNLICACFDCNRGKKNIPLSKIPNQMHENLEILQEKEDQMKQYNSFLKKIRKRENAQLDELDEIFISYYPKRMMSDHFKSGSLRHFLKQLPFEILKENIHSACLKINKNSHNAIKYFCGICWNMIRPKK